jgi:hypothetical protein
VTKFVSAVNDNSHKRDSQPDEFIEDGIDLVGFKEDDSSDLPTTEKEAKKRVRAVKPSKLPDTAPTVATRETNPVTVQGLPAPQSTSRVL